MFSSLFKQRFFPLRYPLVGGLTYIIESSLYVVLFTVFTFGYFVSYVSAGLVAFAINFIGHRLFTFRGQKVSRFGKQLFLEGCLKVAMLAGRTGILYALVQSGLSPLVGPLVTIVAAVITFLGTSFIFGGSRPTATLKLVLELLKEGVPTRLRK